MRRDRAPAVSVAELGRLLVKLGRDAEYVMRDLEAIRDELARSGTVLSPSEYETVSASLIPIGLAGAEILVDDLERAAELEAET